MWRKVALGSVIGLAFGCAGAQRSSKRVQATDARQVSAVVAPTQVRGPSERVRDHWKLGPSPLFSLYADFRGLRNVWGAEAKYVVLAAVLPSPEQRKCINALAARATSITFGADADAGLAIIELNERTELAMTDDGKAMGIKELCAGSAVSPAFTRFADLGSLYAIDGVHMLLEPGLALIGDDALLAGAIRPSSDLGTDQFPSGFELVEDQDLVFRWEDEEVVQAHGDLRASKKRMAFEAEFDFATVEGAEQAEQLVRRIQTSPKDWELREMIGKLTSERNGTHLRLAAETDAPSTGQAQAARIAAHVAGEAARGYAHRAKTAEAPDLLARIGEQYLKYWSAQPNGFDPKKDKLFSLPPVPPSVPAGTSYDSTPALWVTWERLNFAPFEPLRYQYEIVVSKDGAAAVIHARGDLDGNGKLSDYQLPVHFDPELGSLQIGELQETDPDE